MGVCVLMLFSCYNVMRIEFRGMEVGNSCVVTADMLHASVLAYAEENNGQLPDSESWIEQISPYYQRVYNKFTTDFEQDGRWYAPLKPMEPGGEPTCEFLEGVSRITFNAELAGSQIGDVEDPEATALLFETEEQSDTFSLPYTEQPEDEAPRVMRVTRDWIVKTVQEEEVSGPFGYTANDALP